MSGAVASQVQPSPSNVAPRIPWWRLPFCADTWLRTLYVLTALPVAVGCLVLAIAGRSVRAVSVQRRLARRLLGLPSGGQHRAGTGGVIAHSLASVPVNLAAAVITGYVWTLAFANIAFPLRAGDLNTSWGGPSLAGAWAVHGAAGLVFLFVAPWVVRAVTWLQARLLHRLLGV